MAVPVALQRDPSEWCRVTGWGQGILNWRRKGTDFA